MPANPPSRTAPVSLRAQLLGPVRLAVQDREIPDQAWPRRNARALLLLLLASPGNRLSRDRITDLLWPDVSPESALTALRVSLHALRRVLEPGLKVGRDSAYVQSRATIISIRPDVELWIDVVEFESALSEAATTPVVRPSKLREALALYGGDLLADDLDAEWTVARRERLRQAWRRAALDLAELERGRGPLASVPVLERLLATDPADEGAHRALMRAFVAAGRRGEALLQYARCVAALRDELDAVPDAETEALVAEIRSTSRFQSTPMTSTGPAQAFDNLPAPPTPLLGRDRELQTLQDLLLDPRIRLVTVTGPGGIGKTRLALEAAQQAVGDVADGVCFVSLAAIRDPQLVLPAAARALDVDEISGPMTLEILSQALRGREVLLVLDNFEQVIGAATDVGALLASCSKLTVLATSRQPLGLRGEHVVAAPPLAVPRMGARASRNRLRASSVTRYAAVALFAERARAVQPGFVLTDADAAVVISLCARLDGLPLAIELAAARCRHLAPAELLSLLERRLPLLTDGARDLPERQRTLWDAVAWSHDLLGSEEQVLFRRLSVFVGGFSLEAASSVCTASGDVASGVWALADKSMLQREDGLDSGSSRFRMLETIREFAMMKLDASGEEDTIRGRHADYFLKVVEKAEPHLHQKDQISWLDRLEAEHDNMRAALGWTCERRDADTALGISGALSEFWRMGGYLEEGKAWLERALTLAADTPSVRRALCQRGAGILAQAQGESDQAVSRLTESLNDWRALGDQRRTGETLGLLGELERTRGDYPKALELSEEALKIFEAIDHRPGIADTLNRLGLVATDRGEYTNARGLFERSGALYEARSDRYGPARVLNNLGVISFWQEDYHRAAALFEESLALWRALGDRPHTAMALANLGEALRADGDLGRAMTVAREGLHLSREVGDRRTAAMALFILGSLIQHHEIDPAAAEPLMEGLLDYQQVGDRLGMVWCLEALSGPAATTGRPELAAQLLGAAEVLRDQVGVPLQPAERAAYHRHVNAARRVLPDPAAFQQAWAAGRALDIDAAVAMAVELLYKPIPRAAPVSSRT